MTSTLERPARSGAAGPARQTRNRPDPGRRRMLVLSGLLALTVVLFVLAITTGSVSLGLADPLRGMVGLPALDPAAQTLIAQVRLPRAVTAACAGAALAAAGLQMQTLFRNPLADPFSLGVSSGASLGVAVLVTGVGAAAGAGFTAGLGVLGRFGTVSAAAVGAGLVLALVLALSRRCGCPPCSSSASCSAAR